MAHVLLTGIQSLSSIAYRGAGYLAGEPPVDPADPDSPDGRTKMLGALARVRVTVVDRSSMSPIAQTVSDANGEWRIDHISPNVAVTVLFWNDAPALVDVGGEMRPINSFMQDWIRAEPYGP